MSDYQSWFTHRPAGVEWRNYRYGAPAVFEPSTLRIPAQRDPLDEDPCIDTGADRSPVQCSQCSVPDYAYRMDDDGLCTTCHRYKHDAGYGLDDWKDYRIVECCGCGEKHHSYQLNASSHCTKCFIDILDEDPGDAFPF